MQSSLGPFLKLVKLGIGLESSSLPNSYDWQSIHAIAEKQGLLAVIVDGMELLPAGMRPSSRLVLQMAGEVMQGYEARFELYRRTIAEMAGFYNAHGFNMMALKGLACGMDWPRPEHRPYGDVDIWLFGKQKEADEVLSREKGVAVDRGQHHHTVFYWKGVVVENHYDFLNVHHHRSNAELELVLKDLGKDDRWSMVVEGEKVYLPSPNLHALFLLRHMMKHFAAEEITLRHVLDWGFFVRAHGKDVDWKWLLGILDRFEMTKMLHIIDAICVEDLGFDASLFPAAQVDPQLKERVLNEILEPEFSGEMPKGLVRRVVFKFRRWMANGWKHRLCYRESMWSGFWWGVWNHLLKPGSI